MLPGLTPIPAHPSPGRASVLRATSLGCLALTAATGGTKAGVNRQHLIMWFTWSMPSTALAAILATWYDARESTDTDCEYGNPASPCYRMWSRKSNDNGLSWLPDDALSDVVSPLPAQADPNIVGSYVGDYDYGSAILTKHVTSWADGRVPIGGQSQQDAFT